MALLKDKDKVVEEVRANLPTEYEYSGDEGGEGAVAYAAWLQGIPIAYVVVRYSGMDDHDPMKRMYGTGPFRSIWETMSLRVTDRPGGKQLAFVEFNLRTDGGWGKFKVALTEVLAQQCAKAVLGAH